jgi:hypothetical protein
MPQEGDDLRCFAAASGITLFLLFNSCSILDVKAHKFSISTTPYETRQYHTVRKFCSISLIFMVIDRVGTFLYGDIQKRLILDEAILANRAAHPHS